MRRNRRKSGDLKRIVLANLVLLPIREREQIMKRSVGLAGVVCILLSSQAFAQPNDDGLATGPNPAPAKDGFLGPRPWISSFTADQQLTLAKLIDQYANNNPDSKGVKNWVVKEHENTMVDPKLHNVHEANYAQLFTWHHAYLGALEAWLTAQGHPEFVPLPKWLPSTPVPTPFASYGYSKKNPNGKKGVQSMTDTVDWTPFVHSKLGVFTEDATTGATDKTADAQILANVLVVPHNDTHNQLGGVMSTMSSPTVPVFWLYHAFIDDIDTDWKSVHASESKNMKATLPQEQGPRILQGVVKVDDQGNVSLVTEGQGTFNVKDEPWKSLLAGAKDKAVSVQATTDGTDAKLASIITYNGMSELSPTKTAGGTQKLGTFAPMDEVRITGAQGNDLQVRVVGSGRTGFIPKSSVTIGEATSGGDMHSARDPMPGMDMSETPGMTKAMDKGGCASGCGSGCACGSGKACSCGCGCGAADKKKQP